MQDSVLPEGCGGEASPTSPLIHSGVSRVIHRAVRPVIHSTHSVRNPQMRSIVIHSTRSVRNPLLFGELDGVGFVKKGAEGENGPEGVFRGGVPMAARGGYFLRIDNGECDSFTPIGGRNFCRDIALEGEELFGLRAI